MYKAILTNADLVPVVKEPVDETVLEEKFKKKWLKEKRFKKTLSQHNSIFMRKQADKSFGLFFLTFF